MGFLAACATGESPDLGDAMNPTGLGGSSAGTGAGSDSGGTFAESGSTSGGTGVTGGTFNTSGEGFGGTFTGGTFGVAGTGFGTAGTPATAGTGGGGAGGAGGAGGTGSGGKAGAGGTGGKAGAGGTGGSPPNGMCAENPIGAKNTWVASASIHADNCPTPDDTGAYCAPPERGIDGVTTNRYSTGAARTGNEWYQIDFGETVTVSRVVLNTAAGSGDYTLSYEVRMSDSEANIAASTSIISGNGVQGTTTINFPTPKAGRFLRITQKTAMAGWWSLAEVDISCQ